jgi:hypothetical protein
VDVFSVGKAAAQTGWSPRILLFLERSGLVEAFALRLRRVPELRAGVQTWLVGNDTRAPAWVQWEQRKHERLLAA